jgi:hypothetical protein
MRRRSFLWVVVFSFVVGLAAECPPGSAQGRGGGSRGGIRPRPKPPRDGKRASNKGKGRTKKSCGKKGSPTESRTRRKGKHQRTVGKGTKPNRHNLNMRTGKMYRRIVSGLPPRLRARYGNNAQWKAHTEVKALRHLRRGKPMLMCGQKAPCKRCQGEIRDAVCRTGGKVEYLHRSDRHTVRIRYERLPNGDVKRTTSRFDPQRGRNDRVKIHDGKRWRDPPRRQG